jgi:solute carrier family 35 (UDP-sugar transporter), member A1/2/3
MVLKNSLADLWVRNVQLSLFSLVPALVPVLYSPPVPDSRGFIADFFQKFRRLDMGDGFNSGLRWARYCGCDQVLGQYSQRFCHEPLHHSVLASVIRFDVSITLSFLIGSSTMLVATWLYNQRAGKEPTLQ